MKWFLPLLLAALLAGCASLTTETEPEVDPEPEAEAEPDEEEDRGPDTPPDLSHLQEPEPRDEPLSDYGNPASYEVFGETYRVMDLDEADGFEEEGIASWYGKKFDGRRTSSGEPYDMYELTAAHRELPLPTYVRVINQDNDKSVVVRVNDRGPFADNRIIDLSYAAAERIDMLDGGTAPVRIETLSLAFDPDSPREEATTAAQSDANTDDEAGARAYSMEQRDAAPDANGATTGDTYLQVGAFTSEANAKRLVQELEAEDLGPVVVAHGDDDFYRVRLGPLETVDDQAALRRDLESRGLSASEVTAEH